MERVLPRVAAALLVVSLGFPWLVRDGNAGTSIPGWVVPGFCSTTYDYNGWASSSCSPMTIGSPLYVPGTDGAIVSGSSHSARFAIAAGLVCIVLAQRRNRRRWLVRGALAVSTLSVYSAGLSRFTSGFGCALLAAGALAAAAMLAKSEPVTGTPVAPQVV
jgi:hypothetical protein